MVDRTLHDICKEVIECFADDFRLSDSELEELDDRKVYGGLLMLHLEDVSCYVYDFRQGFDVRKRYEKDLEFVKANLVDDLGFIEHYLASGKVKDDKVGSLIAGWYLTRLEG